MGSHRVGHDLATEHACTEAAHSQEWEHSGPLGDTSQFVADKENHESTRTHNGSERRQQGSPGPTAAGGHGSLNPSSPFWRIHSEVRTPCSSTVLTGSTHPWWKYNSVMVTSRMPRMMGSTEKKEPAFYDITELLSCTWSCFEGILSLAAKSMPADLRRHLWLPLRDGIQEMGLGLGQIMEIHFYLSYFSLFLFKTSDTNTIKCYH